MPLVFPEQVAIEPYLNPTYWDDHMIGDGDAERYPLRLDFIANNHRIALDALRERIRDPNSVFPLLSFRQGDEFDPSQFAPGTIVVCREEHLNGYANAMEEAPVDEISALPLPTRKTSINPAGNKSRIIMAGKKGWLNYIDLVTWGIVPSENANYLLTFQGTALSGTLDNVKLAITPRKRSGSVQVGTVQHVSKRTSEKVWRVNALHIVASGGKKGVAV